MSELVHAIRNRAWPGALAAALARWRAHRTIAWATLVSTIARHAPEVELTVARGLALGLATTSEERV